MPPKTKPVSKKTAIPARFKKTVYLDKAPRVAAMLEEACKTRVFSYLALEALEEWCVKNGFDKPVKS